MAAQQAKPGPLSAMVQDALDAGASTRTLAARTLDPETGKEILNKDFWWKMAKGAIPKAPTIIELQTMARALSKPLRIVQEAAARQYLEWEALELSGYDDDMRHIIVRTAAMTPRERRRLRAMLEAADEADDEHRAPTP
jgi:hypothetical protein